jgi:hypothetical protein
MQTRVATSLAKGTAAECAAKLIPEINRQLQRHSPALVMVFASTSQPLEPLQWALREAWPKATILGASTSGEFSERGDDKGSVSLFVVSGDFIIRAGIGEGLKEDVEGAVRTATGALPHAMPEHPHRTAIMLLDPLAGNGEEATLLTSAMLGEECAVGRRCGG